MISMIRRAGAASLYRFSSRQQHAVLDDAVSAETGAIRQAQKERMLKYEAEICAHLTSVKDGGSVKAKSLHLKQGKMLVRDRIRLLLDVCNLHSIFCAISSNL